MGCIAVTTVINLPASGGRREFVYDCGVIGLCPPCTRATPLTGVGSLLVGGWGREPCAHAPESKPTRQQGSCALLAGGSLPRALPRVNPPANRDSVPCCQGARSQGYCTYQALNVTMSTPDSSLGLPLSLIISPAH